MKFEITDTELIVMNDLFEVGKKSIVDFKYQTNHRRWSIAASNLLAEVT